MVELEKTAITRQRLVETRFCSNRYAGINQHVAKRLTLLFVAADLGQRHIHGNDFLKDKHRTGTLRSDVLYSVLLKL
jgi:hypothetical protein